MSNHQKWIRVNQNYTLGDVLKYKNYVIPGIPVIHVYARNAYDFLKNDDRQMPS